MTPDHRKANRPTTRPQDRAAHYLVRCQRCVHPALPATRPHSQIQGQPHIFRALDQVAQLRVLRAKDAYYTLYPPAH